MIKWMLKTTDELLWDGGRGGNGEDKDNDCFCNHLLQSRNNIYYDDIRNSVVDSVRDLKWCPAPGCDKVIKSVSASTKAIRCVCGFSWCFACSSEDHRPCSCEDWKLWVNKLGSESENVNWILANTKICPKCKVHIEKNQGCNHMTCRKCRHEFCWICKGEWRSHRGCGGIKYEQKKEEENALKAKTELSKYMYYVTRYEAHEKSMKFAQDQLDGCNKR
mmetsp:Transcript_3894/g.6151  ORF Transcript_3894/g.6151 Transcript_3894/m.6151 type:complete len:219 (-) Transcript_3894:843-1499(-)